MADGSGPLLEGHRMETSAISGGPEDQWLAHPVPAEGSRMNGIGLQRMERIHGRWAWLAAGDRAARDRPGAAERAGRPILQ